MSEVTISQKSMVIPFDYFGSSMEESNTSLYIDKLKSQPREKTVFQKNILRKEFFHLFKSEKSKGIN
jgi:hypothetical protein